MNFTGLPGWAVAVVILGAAGVLFVLHLLRIRPRERTVPTLLFWRKVLLESQARRLGGRFRHPRTWVFLVVIAALLALALGAPESAGERERPLVLVLDVGPTMGAALGAGDATRFEQARTRLLAHADGAALSRSLAVVTTSPRAANAVDEGTPRALVTQRVGALELDPLALPVARVVEGTLARHPGAEVHVFTDRAPDVGSATAVTWHRSVDEAPDQAITGIGFDDGLRVWVSGPAIEGRRVVVRDATGAERARTPLLAADGEALATARLSTVAPNGDLVTVSLEPPDALRANDAVPYRLPDHRTRRVHVDPALPGAVRWLCEQDERLELVTEPTQADVLLVASAADVADLDLVALAHDPLRTPRAVADRLAANHGSDRVEGRAGDVVVAAFAGRVLATRTTAQGRPALALPPACVEPRGPWMRRPERTAELLAWIHAAAGSAPGAIAVAEGGHAELALADDSVPAALDGGALTPALRPLEPLGTHASLDAAGTATLSVVATAAAPRAVQPAPAEGGAGAGSSFEWFEWLLILALALFLIDAWLHLSGRIP